MNELSLNQRIEAVVANRVINLPAGALRILAGKPIVREGQTLDVQTQMMLRLQRLRNQATFGVGEVAEERATIEVQASQLAPQATGQLDVRDIQLAGGAGTIPGRLYRPARCGSNAPVLIFYHGGGFVIGSLNTHDDVCRALADRAECVVISVDYRLAPENPAPAATEDAIAVFRDIVARADEFDIDAARIALGGDSAGGNLATVVAQQTRNDPTEACFQLLFYPVTDHAYDRESRRTFAEGFFLEQASIDWFKGHYIPADMDLKDLRISPIYGDVAGLPPALVVTGGFDPLRDEGETYAENMKAAGVTVELRRMPSMIHGFLNFAGAVHGADAALTEAAQTLKSALDR